MKITIVTPSYNQGKWINQTIESIWSQAGVFFIEHLIMDGGSTDETVEIIKKYEAALAVWPVRCKGLTFKWVSEKDIKGGAAFFRGPHTLPTDWISSRFENDIKAFGQACEKLGGTPLAFGDAAFVFEITPAVPVAVVYWQGDEEFPPETKLLFDRTIDRHLPLDIIFALAVEICHTVSARS